MKMDVSIRLLGSLEDVHLAVTSLAMVLVIIDAEGLSKYDPVSCIYVLDAISPSQQD